MDEYRIVANPSRGELNDGAFDSNLLRQLTPLYRNSIPPIKKVVVDLQQVRFANPYGALGIVVLCEVLYSVFDRRKVELLLPDDDGGLRFSSWLDSLGFFNAIEDIAEIKGYFHSPRVNPKPSFIPVTRLDTWDDVFRAVDEIEEKLQPILVERLEYTLDEAYRFLTVMSELCQNIWYHSAPEGNPHGYIAMQAYSKNLKFAAMDLGVGIPETLKSKYAFDDDRDAINRACSPGVTSKDRGGLGLWRTVEIVDRAGGYLNIRSGTAKVLFTPEGNIYEGDRKIFSSLAYFLGTQIGILLPRRSQRRMVSDEFEDLRS